MPDPRPQLPYYPLPYHPNNPFPFTLPQLPYYPLHYPYPFPFTHYTTLTLFPFALVPLLPLYPCTLYTVFLVYILVLCILYPVCCILGIYPCTLYTVPCILYTLYNCILLLIFDRPHRCLGAAPVPCGPLPRAPGAPPWGGSRHQSTTVNGHLFFATKFS